MLNVNPYLNFSGNTEAAMNFYKQVFCGDFKVFQRFKDVPGSEKMNAKDQEKILHISLALPNGTTLMATDFLESPGQKLTIGNNFHICLNTDSEEEADKLFGLLAEGAKVEMPLNKTFWGAYFGMLKDKFGVAWMISYSYPQK